MPAQKVAVPLTRQQVEDILSALSFFQSDYPKAGSEQTRKAMERLSRKFWTVIRREFK